VDLTFGVKTVNTEKIAQTSEADLILVNITEELAINCVRHAINEIDMCNCKKCQLYACALALNSLPPRYIMTSKSELLADIGVIDTSSHMEVIVSVSKALKTIRECPLH
jgi:competence protein ComFB